MSTSNKKKKKKKKTMSACPLCPLCNKNPKARSVNYCAPCNNIMTIYRQHRFKEACLSYKGNVCTHCSQGYVQSVMCFRSIEGGSGSGGAPFSRKTGAVPLSADVRAELDRRIIVCSNCERAEYRSASKPTRRKLEALAFLGGRCSVPSCRYAASPSALEFHHKAGRGADSKALQVSDWSRYDLGALYNELNKCVILCANCHSTEHFVGAQEERITYVREHIIDEEWRAKLLDLFEGELALFSSENSLSKRA